MNDDHAHPSVDIDVRDHVGVVSINRPHVRNAIDKATADAIAVALDRFDSDSGVRVIVISGQGGFFCAGMDLKSLAATGERPITASRGAFGIVEKPPLKPTIAAVEGAALGGGFEIALAADMIIAASDSVFGLPEVRRGLVATAGGVLRLPVRIPRAVALELIMSGSPITAERAAGIGLVNHVVPPGDALSHALSAAAVIADNAPMAVRAAKAVAVAAAHWPETEGFTLQRQFTDPVRESADAQEGAAAFVAKRTPVWQDA